MTPEAQQPILPAQETLFEVPVQEAPDTPRRSRGSAVTALALGGTQLDIFGALDDVIDTAEPSVDEAIEAGRARADFDLAHPELQQLPLPRLRAPEVGARPPVPKWVSQSNAVWRAANPNAKAEAVAHEVQRAKAAVRGPRT